jgi:alpha-1,3-rhamnosyl/mannosyltransferase
VRVGISLLPTANLDNGHGSYTLTLLEQVFAQSRHIGAVLAPDGSMSISVPQPHELIRYRRNRLTRLLPVAIDPAMQLTAARVAAAAGVDVIVGNAQWALPRLPSRPLVSILYETELLQAHPWGLYDNSLIWEGAAYLRRNLGRSAAVVAISEYARSTAISRLGVPPERIHVSPPAVRRFAPCTSCPGTPDRPYVAMVGWFHPRKDLPLALAAWRVARDAGLKHDLVLIGEEGGADHVHGSVARRVLEAAGPWHTNVHVTGGVPRSHLGHLIADAGALLVSSRHEGFGIPVIEAFSLGTPVVAVDRASLREVVAGHGAVVQPTPDALAQALLDVTERPPDATAARAYAATFTPERQMKGFWSALETVTGH